MRGFYLYGQGLSFSPRVRPVAKRWDSFFQCWRVQCRVTGRSAAHRFHGYTPGREVWTRPRSLYATRRVQRGTCGRLVYSDPITAAELDSLPVVDGGAA